MVKGNKVMVNKYAVVVGIGHQFGIRIRGDNDARLMKQILRRAGFNQKNIKLLTNNKATRQAVIDNLKWLNDIQDIESEVIYFQSSHGAKELIYCYDGGITSAEMAEILSSFVSQKQLVIFHACYSGSVIDNIEADHRLVLTAMTSNEIHYSTFGYQFLQKAIKEKLADIDLDGKVSIQDAYNYIHNQGIGIMSDNYGQEFFL